jgi:hypothetical protein
VGGIPAGSNGDGAAVVADTSAVDGLAVVSDAADGSAVELWLPPQAAASKANPMISIRARLVVLDQSADPIGG